jgi:hypothetical protein
LGNNNNKHDLATSFRSPGIIECGFYSHGVSKYLELFSSDRVKIIIFDEWTKDALNTINALIEFLGVNYKFGDSIKIQKDNAARNYGTSIAFLNSVISNSMVSNSLLLSKIYVRLPAFAQDLLKNVYHTLLSIKSSSPKQSISNETRAVLRDIYWEDVQELEKILGRRLPWQDFQT